VGELDRVLGGGLVPGAVVLLAGEPGVGKSTLLLDVAQQWAAGAGTPSLVVSGEESVSQVRLRAERLGALHERLYLASESDLSAVLGHLDAVKPGLLIIDSVQTISAPGTEGVPGGVTQVRAVTAALVSIAKERGVATVLVGHVTKDGSVAGPRVLEHLVDVVLHFEGDKHSSLRLVRGVKNRHGVRPTRWAVSRCTRPASSASPIRPGCSSPATTSPSPAPASRWPWRAAGRW